MGWHRPVGKKPRQTDGGIDESQQKGGAASMKGYGWEGYGQAMVGNGEDPRER